MNHRATFALTAALLVSCAPSPETGTDAAQASRPAMMPSAANFDVGPIMSAESYLEDAEYADADLERGELLSLACIACHTLEAGRDHVLGPNLSGVFGAAAAQKPGFEYSPALVNAGLVWTPRALDAWLAAPARFVPGTSMVFAGYADSEDRRNLIAYLLGATQVPPQ
ncbi:MAG: c-type cytochrome [Gammaproteobacteria bacterium]|nr:c-type cytochrome [Gammaproteobacteria bacterium]